MHVLIIIDVPYFKSAVAFCTKAGSEQSARTAVWGRIASWRTRAATA
jgi:hypothetical protein